MNYQDVYLTLYLITGTAIMAKERIFSSINSAFIQGMEEQLKLKIFNYTR